jgi:hypothetical protein
MEEAVGGARSNGEKGEEMWIRKRGGEGKKGQGTLTHETHASLCAY